MIDHAGIGVASMTASARFDDATLKTLGLRRVVMLPENVGSNGIGYGVEYPIFWIDQFHLPGYYAAFVRDPDGNNMEAVFRER
jgi:hypothetical protein